MPYLATVRSISSRFSLPSRTSVEISCGQRARPLPSPWVRLATQKPPLRPEAAQPTPAFEQDDVERGVAFLGHEGGPQTGEPAADHCQVGGRVLEEPPQRLGFVRTVQPVRLTLRVSQCFQRIHDSTS